MDEFFSPVKGTTLFIGSYYSASLCSKYKKTRPMDVVINVCCDDHDRFLKQEFKEEEIDYFYLPIDDCEDQELIQSCVKPVFDIIEKYPGKNILIHCYMGISRSVSCVIYYLIMKLGLNYEDALALVRKTRKVADPNDGFAEALIQLSKSEQEVSESTTLATQMSKSGQRSSTSL